jgi:DNA-binding CsgD family transcriptional regulator
MIRSRAQNGKKAPFGLTPRELEVLRHAAEGRTSSQIAELLGMTSRTAEIHTHVIVVTFGVAGIPQAVAIAVREGIIAP